MRTAKQCSNWQNAKFWLIFVATDAAKRTLSSFKCSKYCSFTHDSSRVMSIVNYISGQNIPQTLHASPSCYWQSQIKFRNRALHKTCPTATNSAHIHTSQFEKMKKSQIPTEMLMMVKIKWKWAPPPGKLVCSIKNTPFFWVDRPIKKANEARKDIYHALITSI